MSSFSKFGFFNEDGSSVTLLEMFKNYTSNYVCKDNTGKLYQDSDCLSEFRSLVDSQVCDELFKFFQHPQTADSNELINFLNRLGISVYIEEDKFVLYQMQGIDELCSNFYENSTVLLNGVKTVSLISSKIQSLLQGITCSNYKILGNLTEAEMASRLHVPSVTIKTYETIIGNYESYGLCDHFVETNLVYFEFKNTPKLAGLINQVGDAYLEACYNQCCSIGMEQLGLKFFAYINPGRRRTMINNLLRRVVVDNIEQAYTLIKAESCPELVLYEDVFSRACNFSDVQSKKPFLSLLNLTAPQLHLLRKLHQADFVQFPQLKIVAGEFKKNVENELIDKLLDPDADSEFLLEHLPDRPYDITDQLGGYVPPLWNAYDYWSNLRGGVYKRIRHKYADKCLDDQAFIVLNEEIQAQLGVRISLRMSKHHSTFSRIFEYVFEHEETSKVFAEIFKRYKFSCNAQKVAAYAYFVTSVVSYQCHNFSQAEVKQFVLNWLDSCGDVKGWFDFIKKIQSAETAGIKSSKLVWTWFKMRFVAKADYSLAQFLRLFRSMDALNYFNVCNPESSFDAGSILKVCEHFKINLFKDSPRRTCIVGLGRIYGKDHKAIIAKVESAQKNKDPSKPNYSLAKAVDVLNTVFSYTGDLSEKQLAVVSPVLKSSDWQSISGFAPLLKGIDPEQVTNPGVDGLAIAVARSKYSEVKGFENLTTTELRHFLENEWTISRVSYFLECKSKAKEEQLIPKFTYQSSEHKIAVKHLDIGDTTALYIGELTGCCQHINGGYGAKAALQSYTDSWCDVMAIYNEDQSKLVSQAFIWLNKEKNMIVIDSLESMFSTSNKDAVEKSVQGCLAWIKHMTDLGYSIGFSNCSYGITNVVKTRLVKAINVDNKLDGLKVNSNKENQGIGDTNTAFGYLGYTDAEVFLKIVKK